jgi:hypothetical protein
MTHCLHCKTETAAAALAVLPKIKNTDATAQEAALLADLRRAGSKGLTTDDLRAAGYYQCNARIWGLRHRWGADVHTELYDGFGADGVYHLRMARYRLISEPPVKPAKQARKPKAATQQLGEGACT